MKRWLGLGLLALILGNAVIRAAAYGIGSVLALLFGWAVFGYIAYLAAPRLREHAGRLLRWSRPRRRHGGSVGVF